MFAVVRMFEVRGTIPVFKLVVEGDILFDEFCSTIRTEGNLVRQLTRIVAIMERYSNGQLLSASKLKLIGRSKSGLSLYEIKTHDLRVYLFRDFTGAIVVSGGKKSTQATDIRRFKNIVDQYNTTL